MTKQLYLTNTYLFEATTVITAQDVDERGSFLLLDQTVFYPQGGGQPSDHGLITGSSFELKVMDVRLVEDQVRHYFETGSGVMLVNQAVNCRVDQECRILNAKYHTGGHLLSSIVEKNYPSLKAIKGHHFPGEGYVEFSGSVSLDTKVLQAALNQAITYSLAISIFEIDPVKFEDLYYKLPYKTPDNKVFRCMRIKHYPPLPCGGTHLKNTSELLEVIMGKIKTKNDSTKISYTLS